LLAFHFHSVLLIFVNLWPISTLCVADMVHLWPIWFVADIVCGRYIRWFVAAFPSERLFQLLLKAKFLIIKSIHRLFNNFLE